MNSADKTARRNLLARTNVWLLAIWFVLLLYNVIFTHGFHLFTDDAGHANSALVMIFRNGAEVMLLAIGMTLVIATAGIDLSVGSVMALSGACAAMVLSETSGSAALAIAAGVSAALVIGLWNGISITFIGLQPIVATLITLVAGRGLAQWLTDDEKPSFSHAGFEALGRGDVFSVPVPIIIVGVTLGVIAILLRKTVLGLYVEAVGANPRAARLCGLRVHSIRLFVYAFSGLYSGVAGLIYTADIGLADVTNCGLYLELDAILAVVIGGTSLMGGRPRLIGTILGALIMQTLTVTLLMHDVQTEQSLIVKAIIAIVVCAMQSPQLTQRFQRTLRRGAMPVS